MTKKRFSHPDPQKVNTAQPPRTVRAPTRHVLIVNVYSDETPGREFVDRARAALLADEVARATKVGRRLTIKEPLDLARIPETASV